MNKFFGFLSLVGGLVVLVGEVIKSLGDKYYLVYAGAAVCIVAGLLSLRRRYY